MPIRNIPLGQILLESKLISTSQLEEALKQQKKDLSRKLGDILVEMGAITERQLMRALETRLKVPYIDLAATGIDGKAPGLIPEELARRHNIIPIAVDGRQLTVATGDPMNFYAIDDVRLATNMEIRTVLCSPSDIRAAVDRYYSSKNAEEAAADLSRAFDNTVIHALSEEVGDRIDNAPVVRLVNSMIEQAVRLNASDIHIEPMESKTRVRMRIDGVLQEQMAVNAAAHASIVTRLKIMGNMDIAEKRVPQDGRVETVVDGRTVDLRLSVLPTVTGEKIVIRILGATGRLLSVSELGLSPENKHLFESVIKSPSGLILVSGPTGSGKTTTLYSILGSFNRPGVNIITVEDPVEYRLSGVNQVQVNPKAGLTFASGLRSILRQDPDIVMVGEIRDDETAQIAVRAAITGHLVLSTIHTGDTASTVSRLINMHIEPYLVSGAVVGVMAQRLVRSICPRCKASYVPSDSERRLIGLAQEDILYRGTGCNYCAGSGYRGRTAVHEILVVTKELRALIDGGATADAIREASVKNGTVPLQESCRELVRAGQTTVEEMLRATYSNG